MRWHGGPDAGSHTPPQASFAPPGGADRHVKPPPPPSATPPTLPARNALRTFFRPWIPPTPHLPPPPSSTTFSLLSWNVLAPSLVDPSYLGFASEEDLAWSVRGPRVHALLQEQRPDIVCLQEDDRYPEFLDALNAHVLKPSPAPSPPTMAPSLPPLDPLLSPGATSSGTPFGMEGVEGVGPAPLEPFASPSPPSMPAYAGRWKKRTGPTKADGCSVLWRTQRFELVEAEEVEYRIPGCEFLDRDNVAILVVLQERGREGRGERGEGGEGGGEGRKLVVANTHLLFNPRRGDVKLAQLQVLLARVQALRSRHPSADVGA